MEFSLSVSNALDEESWEEIFEMTRDKVTHLGARLSFLLVESFFAVSSGEDELMMIIQNLRALLEPRIWGGKLVVGKILALLETGEIEVWERSANLNKLTNKAEEEKPVELKNPEIILRIYEQIIFLEETMTAVLTRPVWGERLIRDLSLCEKERDAIAKKIRSVGSSFGNIDHVHLRETMDAKVRKLWTIVKLYY